MKGKEEDREGDTLNKIKKKKMAHKFFTKEINFEKNETLLERRGKRLLHLWRVSPAEKGLYRQGQSEMAVWRPTFVSCSK